MILSILLRKIGETGSGSSIVVFWVVIYINPFLKLHFFESNELELTINSFISFKYINKLDTTNATISRCICHDLIYFSLVFIEHVLYKCFKLINHIKCIQVKSKCKFLYKRSFFKLEGAKTNIPSKINTLKSCTICTYWLWECLPCDIKSP